MTVTDVHKDPERPHHDDRERVDAPIDRVWQLWADPRQLERWWGPPTYPATVVDHDLAAAVKVSYFMTGPEGDSITAGGRSPRSTSRTGSTSKTASPTSEGKPNDDMPTMQFTVTLTEMPSGVTRMVIETSSHRAKRWTR